MAAHIKYGSVMQWRNEAEWQAWHDRKIGGISYSFSHLRSFDMEVVRPAKGDWAEFKCKVRVVFDCHVVTRGLATGELLNYNASNFEHWKDTGGNLRLFSLQRYTLSLSLPPMLSALPAGKMKCYMAKKTNYMVWKPEGATGDKHYQAFFDIYKPTSHTGSDHFLVLYVQSAYLKDEPLAAQRDRFKSFAQLCAELCGVVESKKDKKKKKKKAITPKKLAA